MGYTSKTKVRVQRKRKNTPEENYEGYLWVKSRVHRPKMDSAYAAFKRNIVFPPKGTVFECKELAPDFWDDLTRGYQIMTGIRFSEDVDANKIPGVIKITPHKGGPIKYLMVL